MQQKYTQNIGIGDGYVLPRDEREYERLRQQAHLWADYTQRVLTRAGLTAGMSVLDAGCGPCEVMRLMGRIVGTQGNVTGVDIDAKIGQIGVQRLRSEEKGNFSFYEGDLLSLDSIPGAPFDLVFCRFVLIHMVDPVALVRRMAALIKPGGILLAMDYVSDAIRVAPEHPQLLRGMEIINATLAKTGKTVDAGLRLGQWFREAGLPMPQGTDLHGRFEVLGADPMLADAVAGFGEQAVQLGIATAEEIAALPSAIRNVAARGEHCFHWPTLTAAWTRVS